MENTPENPEAAAAAAATAAATAAVNAAMTAAQEQVTAAGINLPEQQLRDFVLNVIHQHTGAAIAPQVAQAESTRLARDTQARLPKPDKFDGGKRPKDAEEWLFVIDNYLNASRVTLDIERITVASGYLTGPALTWWRSLQDKHPPERPTTWKDFQQTLLNTFRSINPVENARDMLARLRQTTSVRQYATAMRDAALTIASITDDELKDRFIRGLKSATQMEVRMRAPATFAEAVQLAERYDNLRYATMRSSHQASPFRGGGSNGPAPMELGAAVDAKYSSPAHNGNQRRPPRLTPQLRQQLIKEGKCFYCRQPGHMALDCPEKKKKQGK